MSLAFEGTPLPSRMNSMYQPGGARFRVAGAVTVIPPAAP